MVDVVKVAMGTGIEEEEIAIGDGELAVTAPSDGIRCLTGCLGRRLNLQLVRTKNLQDFVDCGIRVSGLGVQF